MQYDTIIIERKGTMNSLHSTLPFRSYPVTTFEIQVIQVDYDRWEQLNSAFTSSALSGPAGLMGPAFFVLAYFEFYTGMFYLEAWRTSDSEHLRNLYFVVNNVHIIYIFHSSLKGLTTPCLFPYFYIPHIGKGSLHSQRTPWVLGEEFPDKQHIDEPVPDEMTGLWVAWLHPPTSSLHLFLSLRPPTRIWDTCSYLFPHIFITVHIEVINGSCTFRPRLQNFHPPMAATYCLAHENSHFQESQMVWSAKSTLRGTPSPVLCASFFLLISLGRVPSHELYSAFHWSYKIFTWLRLSCMMKIPYTCIEWES